MVMFDIGDAPIWRSAIVCLLTVVCVPLAAVPFLLHEAGALGLTGFATLFRRLARWAGWQVQGDSHGRQ
jgi:hypothetical protein